MAKLNIADIRQEYTKGGLRESELPGDPLSLFSRWLQEAIDAEVDEPTAVIVGTVSPEGRPSTRTVLLKGLHEGKFIFYTNYESRKGRQLAQNPSISLSFVWHALERQIHIEGIAMKVSPEESDEYFRKRPYKSRIGARISPQSQPIASRIQLIRSFVKEAARWIGKEVEVLVEEETEIEGRRFWIGHTKEYMKILIESEENLQNTIIRVQIKNHSQIIH